MQLSKLRECEATDAQKLLSQSEKVAKCILRAKLNYMKSILSNEMNCFLQCRRQHFTVSDFCRKSHLELKCTNHFFRASRTPILCLVQLSKLRECEATDAQKLLSVRKSC